MATSAQEMQIARQSCRSLYHDYVGRKPGGGKISQFERRLLAEAAASAQNPEEKRLAVLSYFTEARDRLWVLRDSVERAKSVDEMIDIGLMMQRTFSSLGDTPLDHVHDAELFSLLRAAQVTSGRGAHLIMLFRGILHEDSRLVVRTGIEGSKERGVQVNLLRGNGSEEAVGWLAISQKDGSTPAGQEEVAGGEVPRTMAMRAWLAGSQAADPQGAAYNLFYAAEQDYSKAIYQAEKFIYGLAHDRAEANRVMSSPFLSFVLRTPHAREEPRMHLEAWVKFTLDSGMAYSLVVTLPGGRLHAHCSSSSGATAQRWQLTDCASNNVGC